MKSIKKLAYVSAIALVSMGFVACNNNNDPENTNEENAAYSGETVKTQFLVSIAGNEASSGKRFMHGTEVQEAGTRAQFRGMESICLIPFDGDYVSRIGKNITLTAIPAASASTEGSLNDANSVYYEDVAIPIGTKRFLFYGKAIDNTEGVAITGDEDKHKFGIVTANNLYGVAYDPANISFSLNPIYSASTTPASATALANYVTSIANATDGTTAWSAHSNSAVVSLRNSFLNLTAGSSFSIQATVTDLYKTLMRFQATQVTPDAVVTAIIAAIEAGADVTDNTPANSDDFDYTLALKSANNLTNYPASINLPDGVAKIKWQTNKFVVDAPAVGDFTMTSLNQIVYPASLQYYGESTIKTSRTSKKDLYDGNKTWTQIIDDANYEEGTEVKTTSKSVALVDPINYGVGQLRTTVQHDATLADYEGTDYILTTPLKWTAVLIGGQKTVNSDFTQKTSETNIYTIYDNYLPTTGGVDLTTTASAINYTLVFSTEDNTSKDKKINIAIELVNTNATFVGQGGQIIPAGSKFYLVGQLDAGAATGVDDTNHPQNYNIFYKDYYTTAKLTIKSLAKAYNTIPDLRSEGLELGFSIDLTWQAGLAFDIDL